MLAARAHDSSYRPIRGDAACLPILNKSMTAFLRTVFVSLVLCSLVLLGYWRLTVDRQAKAIAELQALKSQMEAKLAERQAMIERLSRSRRVAHIQVKDQKTDEDGTISQTSLQFIELSEQGAEIGRQAFTIPGDVLYVDAWTVKFDAERVAEGDPLRGRTLLLLRRLYSDRLAPKDGMLIDTPGAIPPGYAASDIGHFEKRVWDNFWTIATDAEMAKKMGVRVAQGEAVYKPVRAGQTYEFVVDAVGGMSLMPLPSEKPALTKAGG